MRVNLRGINKTKKTLSDGSVVEYYYAWKGGPRLPGKPGSPEYVAAYYEAVKTKIVAPVGKLRWLIDQYEQSSDFAKLAQRTRKDYVKQIKIIEAKFSDFPLSGLSDDRATGIFLAWRDDYAKRSLRQADYAFTVLARILSWGVKRKIVRSNPCAKHGRLYDASRVENIWTDADETKFFAVASEQMKLAFMLAIWTGQRQGDLLRLPWSAYDGEYITLVQSKSVRLGNRRRATRVKILVGQPLKALLDVTKKVGPLILVNSAGTVWTEEGFRSSWRKTCKRAGIRDLTFHDLRGTAVTRLALADCTEAEIATITGHTLSDVGSILDAHYLNRDPELARIAITKLEQRRTKSPN